MTVFREFLRIRLSAAFKRRRICWEQDANRGAVAFLAGDVNIASVSADELVTDGKTETGAGRFGGEEGVKDVTHHRVIHSPACVAELDPDSRGLARGLVMRRHDNGKGSTAVGHGFDGVLDDVVEDLGHAALVDGQRSGGSREVDDHAHTAAEGKIPEGLDAFFEELPDIESLEVKLHGASKIEETIDHAVETLNFKKSDGAGFLDAGTVRVAAAHLDAEADRGERIADLVRNTGDEAAETDETLGMTELVFDELFVLDLLAESGGETVDSLNNVLNLAGLVGRQDLRGEVAFESLEAGLDPADAALEIANDKQGQQNARERGGPQTRGNEVGAETIGAGKVGKLFETPSAADNIVAVTKGDGFDENNSGDVQDDSVRGLMSRGSLTSDGENRIFGSTSSLLKRGVIERALAAREILALERIGG